MKAHPTIQLAWMVTVVTSVLTPRQLTPRQAPRVNLTMEPVYSTSASDDLFQVNVPLNDILHYITSGDVVCTQPGGSVPQPCAAQVISRIVGARVVNSTSYEYAFLNGNLQWLAGFTAIAGADDASVNFDPHQNISGVACDVYDPY